MGAIRKAYDGLFRGVEYVSILFLAGMVIICAINVFMRYVMHAALRWGDEMSLFCMIWYSLLSASLALKENRHIRIDVWDKLLPAKASQILNVVVHVIVVAVLVVLLYNGVLLTELAGRTKMTGSGLRLAYEYVALPVSAVFMLIAAIGRIGEIVGGKC